MFFHVAVLVSEYYVKVRGFKLALNKNIRLTRRFFDHVDNIQEQKIVCNKPN